MGRIDAVYVHIDVAGGSEVVDGRIRHGFKRSVRPCFDNRIRARSPQYHVILPYPLVESPKGIVGLSIAILLRHAVTLDQKARVEPIRHDIPSVGQFIFFDQFIGHTVIDPA